MSSDEKMTAPDYPALLAQARARMNVAERLAKAATEGPWGADRATVDNGVLNIIDPWHVNEFDAAHIAAWHPDVALRMVAWGRDVLDRHTIWSGDDADGERLCEGSDLHPWLCPDVRAVLTAWGVTE